MSKPKMIVGLSLAALLAVGHSVAFADTDHDAFFEKMRQLSPSSEKTLRVVGADYKQKCGFEPSVAQYQNIVDNSPAFTFRLATTVIADGNVSGWSPKEHAQYNEFIKAVDCNKI